ncbi:MAG: RsmE family RNA methyltransferase [Chloroflexota bacterium]
MQRFLVKSTLDGSEVKLPALAARQVATVLRMRPGERLVVFDGSGPEWLGELTEVGQVATVRLLERREPPNASRRTVTLCQAVLKGEKMEWVLQKGTELGVAVFQPILTERVVAHKTQVSERWRRIVIEATEQSGRTVLPALRAPVTLAAALGAGGAQVLCSETERSATLWSYLADGAPDVLSLFVGPEGGFSEAEVLRARDRGAEAVSLGPLRLRAETASVAAASLALLAP